MRLLITGAAGFLGSHLAERFLAEGDEVLGLDNFITGSRANAEILGAHDGFRLIEADARQLGKAQNLRGGLMVSSMGCLLSSRATRQYVSLSPNPIVRGFG